MAPAALKDVVYRSPRYSRMWYKKDSRVGIRRKFGDDKQIFSFGGPNCGKSKDELWAIGGHCLRSLDAGQTEEVVETVAKARLD